LVEFGGFTKPSVVMLQPQRRHQYADHR
jgi:hypothetical protein